MNKDEKIIGSVAVIGGGISGIQASLDLAESGFKVYLIDNSPSIGGNMARLDKTFPTNECAMCVISPKLVDCGRHMNIDILTYTDIKGISGVPGDFKLKILKKARFVDLEKCTGCGDCIRNCPIRNRVFLSEDFVGSINIKEDQKQIVDRIIDSYGDEKGILVSVLGDINTEFGYLSRDVMKYVSRELKIPLTEILRVATFYNAFSLLPRGRNTISVCMGTTCFVKGAGMLFEKLLRDLGIKEGGTTKDLRFTLEKVRCIGCCALAPAIRINNDIYGRLKSEDLKKILKLYK